MYHNLRIFNMYNVCRNKIVIQHLVLIHRTVWATVTHVTQMKNEFLDVCADDLDGSCCGIVPENENIKLLH